MKKENSILIKLNNRKIVLTLSLTAVLIILTSIAGQIFNYSIGNGKFTTITNKFYVDQEENIPTFFSSIILTFTSLLLGMIYLHKRINKDKFRFHWLTLGAAFLFLAIDESTLIYHEFLRERLSIITDKLINKSGAVIATLFMGLFFYQSLKFLLHLSAQYRILFFISALIYISGAVGMDIIGTYYHEVHGKYNLFYSMLATLEKMLEIGGVIFFIHTLMSYLFDLTNTDMTKEDNPEKIKKQFQNKDCE